MDRPLQENLTIAQSDYAIRIASAMAFAILYFDFALTFGAEVDRFWKGPVSLVSFGFFLNRYLSLFGHIPVLYEFYGSQDDNLCQQLQMYHQILSGITQVLVGALQLARVHALYQGSRRILFSLLGLAVIGCVVSGWAISQIWRIGLPARTHRQDSPHSSFCNFAMSTEQGAYFAIVWATIAVFDVAVFGLTLYRILQIGYRCRGSLFDLFLRDGAIYFGVLIVCHMTNILTCLLAQQGFRGISVTTTNVIAMSLIARLMLNIRDPDLQAARYRMQSDDLSTIFDVTLARGSDPHAQRFDVLGSVAYNSTHVS